MDNIKKSFFRGVFWTTIETLINRSFGFIIQLVLARLLFPEDYGLVGMAAVFINFLMVFNDLGMNAALVQRKKEKLNSLHYDTAFWTGVVWSVFLYLLIVFIITPITATFYSEEKIKMIMPILSLSILVSPINLVHRAQLIKSMDFKKLAIINNVSSIFAGTLALILAYLGVGVWALVFYSVVGGILGIPMFFNATKWLPKLRWGKQEFKDIFGFGVYTTGTSLANSIITNIDYLLVGKLVGTAALGIYTFAYVLTNILRNQIVAIINKVIYPVYASMQDDKKQMLVVFTKVVSINNLIVYPIILGLYLFAEDVLPIFFGNKWSEAVPIVEILCFAVFLQMLNNSHTALLRAAGEVKLELYLQIIKCVLFYVPFISLGTYFFKLKGAAYGFTLAILCGVLLSFYYMKRVFGFDTLAHLKTLKASLFMLVFSLTTTLLFKEYFDWWICIIYYLLSVVVIYFVMAKEQIISMFTLIKNRK